MQISLQFILHTLSVAVGGQLSVVFCLPCMCVCLCVFVLALRKPQKLYVILDALAYILNYQKNIYKFEVIGTVVL